MAIATGTSWNPYGAKASTQPVVYSSAPRSSVTENSVLSAYQEALKTLTSSTGDVEKMYQQGKRRTLADIATSSINAGAANTLNLPAASVAYDEANRAQTNVAVAGQKVGVLTDLANALSEIYQTNLGASTSMQQAQLSANTSTANAQLAAQTSLVQSQQQNALSKYIAELNTKTQLELASRENDSAGNYPAPLSYPGI